MTSNIFKIAVFLLIFLLSGCKGCTENGRKKMRQNNQREETKTENVTFIPDSHHNESQQSPNTKESTPPKVLPESEDNGQSIESTSTKKRTLSQLYATLKTAVFTLYCENSLTGEGKQGSGFYVNENGLALTNEHVISGCNKCVIRDWQGRQYTVSRFIYSEGELDFALIEIDITKTPALVFAQENAQVGDFVFAIGSPQGLEHTLSTGIISNIHKEDNLIQTTAEITHGSSGGALFNEKGDVIGITTAGMGEANLNFAIDIQAIRNHLKL